MFPASVSPKSGQKVRQKQLFAPLLFAGNSIIVPIHLNVWTVFQEKGCFRIVID
jgi:hypothetical protein